MELKKFLTTFMSVEELKQTLKLYKLSLSGNKTTLINRILSNSMPELAKVLCDFKNKDELQYICSKMNIKNSGTCYELDNRIISNIYFPDKYSSDYDFIFINKNIISFDYLNTKFLLNRYFTKEILKDLCEDNNLFISGSKDDLIERLINDNISIKEIFEIIPEGALEEIADMLDLKYNDNTSNDELEQIIMNYIDNKKVTVKNKPVTKNTYKYDVAISFAGEQRSIAENIVKELKIFDIKTYYDNNSISNIWGKNLIEHFQSIFRDKSRFCIMLISNEYLTKVWTIHERRSALDRQIKNNAEYILPVKIHNVEVPGLPSSTCYLNYEEYKEKEIANIFRKKILHTIT